MTTANAPTSRPLGHQLIRASAGSGKTYTLSVRYLRLLAHGVEVDRILATTFTRKAAGEIFQRVILRLATAVLEDAERAKLRRDLGLEQFSANRCSQLFSQLMRNLHRVRVGTLDSYFHQLARTFSLELGLPAGWQIADEPQEERLMEQAIQNVLTASDRQATVTLMHRLFKGNSDQRISEQIHKTVRDMHGFWLDACRDAWSRLSEMPAPSAEDLQLALQSLAAFSAPQASLCKAVREDLQRFQAEDWEDFLDKGIAKCVLLEKPTYRKTAIPSDLLAAYGVLIRHIRAILLRILADQNEATGRLLAAFHAEYERCKARAGLQGFRDICCRLAEAQWHSDLVAFRMDTPVEHLLLDEFQDTSHGQWTVLRGLARRICEASKGTFFCVGDIKQAIYGWRGGDARIFDSLHRDLVGLAEEKLDVSRRSAPPIVQFVNHLFQQLRGCDALTANRPAVQEWLDRFPEHSTVHTDLDGYVALECSPEPPDDSEDWFLKFTADRIRQLHGDFPSCSLGVLTRSNKTLAHLMFHLQQLRVDASQEGGKAVTDSAAVHLMVALLRLIDHPGDRISLYHLARSPWGPQLGLDPDAEMEQVAARMQPWREQLADTGYGTVVGEWMAQLWPHTSAHDHLRMQQVQRLAYQFDPQATLRTRDFVDFLHCQRVQQARDAAVRLMTIHQAKGLQFDIVVLAELDCKAYQTPAFVFDRSAQDGRIDCMSRYANAVLQKLLPADHRQMHHDHIQRLVEEALCLLYVAVTRPVHALHLLLPCNCKGASDRISHWILSSLAGGKQPQPDALLYALGRADWQPRAARRPPSGPAPPSDPPVIRLAPPEGSAPLPASSPSRQEGGSVVSLAHLLETATTARRRGTLLHSWLESITWLDQGPPDTGKLERRAASQGFPAAQRDGLLAEFTRFLESDLAGSLLRRGPYRRPEHLGFPPDLSRQLCGEGVRLEVRNEVPVAAQQEGPGVAATLVSGAIDRLILFWKGEEVMAAEVLDFKTDQIAAGDSDAIAARVDFYRPQIEAYKEAVQQMLGLPAAHVTGRLVFLEPRCWVFV